MHTAQSSDRSIYRVRQERLRLQLRTRRLSLLIVTKPANIFYLTGFLGSAGVLAIGPAEALLWVDPRYILQARSDARGVEVVEARKGIHSAAGEWLRRRRPDRVGYEDAHLTCADLAALRNRAESERGGRGGKLRWVGASGLVEKLRAVKDAGEIARIRSAGHLTAAVFEGILPMVRPGVRERDLAAELEHRMRRKGAEGAAFETIVASGRRAAWPHARASSKRLEVGELVIFDLGAILGAYAADMTRTVYLGRPKSSVRRLYNAVLEAQREAIQALREGSRAADVDRAARRVLKHQGLARYFTHSTGHGVGLEVHELPRIGPGEQSRLETGYVVTAEPGVYLEDFGGIRTEDTVLLGANGPEILTPAAKDRWAIA